MIVAGSMIGSGIFIVSADIARTVGCTGYLLLAWLITGFITLVAALSYGELAGMMPHAGGQYVYLREAYNPLIGFLYGWTLFLVIQTGTIAAVAVAFGKFTAVLIPSLSERKIIFSMSGFTISIEQVLAIISIAILTYVNMRGLKGGKTVQNIFTITKLAALFGLIFLGISIGRNPAALSANLSNLWNASWTHMEEGKIISIESIGGWKILVAMGTAMVGSIFASDAWNNITFTAGEVIEPKRNIPLSLALGTGIVTIIYILANVAYISILPLAGTPEGADIAGRGIQFATSDRVATAAASLSFGEGAAAVMAGFIIISTFGCNNGLILSGARVYYAMALDGLFFKRTADLNVHSVPGWALLAQGIWASLLCLSGTYGDLLDYVVFAVLLFYILTIAGVFILRRTKPDAERPYRALGYPIIPALYIIMASVLSVVLLIYKPAYTWPGLIIVILGIPVYFVWKKIQPKPSDTIS